MFSHTFSNVLCTRSEQNNHKGKHRRETFRSSWAGELFSLHGYRQAHHHYYHKNFWYSMSVNAWARNDTSTHCWFVFVRGHHSEENARSVSLELWLIGIVAEGYVWQHSHDPGVIPLKSCLRGQIIQLAWKPACNRWHYFGAQKWPISCNIETGEMLSPLFT